MSVAQPVAVLTILGSGTFLPDAERASAAHHVAMDGASLLLDCGSGALHALAREAIDWAGLTHIALTHFHTDHVADLGGLLVALKHGLTAPRTQPLTILGPRGLQAYLDALREHHSVDTDEIGFPVHVVELGVRAPYAAHGGAFRMECISTPHTESSLAFRVRGPWGTIGYTGDTGPSSEVAELMRGSDVLIAECMFPDAEATETHLSPASLAEMAASAEPGLLVITHVFPTLTHHGATARVAGRYYGEVIGGSDGLRVRISSGEVAVDLPRRPR